MPRSSFSDNPLLRVSRPISACSRCRIAKVKCDGKLPACTACEKAGRDNECSSANDQFARGKERSYVAALESRIEKLEKRLTFARSRRNSIALHDVDENPAPTDRRDSLAYIRAAMHRKAARKREDADVNSMISDFGFLSVNATTRDFEPSLSNMTFARLVLAAATNDAIPVQTEDSFPTREEALATIQYYTTIVFSLFPCFSETHLLAVLDDIYNQDERVKEALKDADYWLVYMVLAIGYSAQSRRAEDDYYRRGLNFVSRALPYADKALMPGYPTQIQSLILFTQYSMLDPAHFDSWYLIGFASRAVIDLGYHQDLTHLQVPDKAALDLRRKMFYSVYALDRTISMVRTRSFSFADDSINVEFPTASGLSLGALTGPQAAPSALLMFQLRRVQSEWYQTLFQLEPLMSRLSSPEIMSYTWQKCSVMREWHKNLPDDLPSGLRELFDVELSYSYVYCLAPNDQAPPMNRYTKKLLFEHAIIYVHIMHRVAHASVNAAFYTSLDALKVYFVGMQFFDVLTRNLKLLLTQDIMRPTPNAHRRGTAAPPPLPHRPINGDNLEVSIHCLQQVMEILGKFSERWDIASSLRTGFESISSDWFSRLQMYQQMGGYPTEDMYQQPGQAQQSQQAQQPPHAQHQQSPQMHSGPSVPQTHHQSYPPYAYPQVLMAPPQMPMPGMTPIPGMMPIQGMMPQPGQRMVQYRWTGDGSGEMMSGPPPGHGSA